MSIQAQPGEAPTASPASRDQRPTLAGLSIITALVNGVQVPVACPADWCKEKHAVEDTRHVEDIDHVGDHVDLYVPDFFGEEDQVFAYAHLGCDLYSSDVKMREAHIRVEDGGGEASYLTPDQADTFASNLDTFSSKIRTLAQVARGTAAPAPGHYSWCEPDACWTYASDDGTVTEHLSARATIQAPPGFDADNGLLLDAYLIADDSMVDSGPRVSAITATGNGQIFGEVELDKLIDQTAAALDQLRAMRLHMKAAQA
ncbi:DUF6907 domain-containing protein [Streptomyces sp. NPDC005808]|uniref:DUF6907 domain-containing protein n=1 Tax=Streptomyces sp. NPDC005808 TaxID=3364734 RepID=UPI0036A0DC2D